MFPNTRLKTAQVPEGVTLTGGNFDRSDWPIYYIASSFEIYKKVSHLYPYILMAINEIREDNIDGLESMCHNGAHLLIDSGIFNLTMEHVRRHADDGLSMNDALGLPPEEIDGFEKLMAKYLSIVERLGNVAWGYIELDQGGRENKIKTRAKLEAMGLKPIPVYHPLNDGWDYFDYLAERYDRICFGNVVQADRETRIRLVATAFERRRKYPYLWIHLLGLTANEWLNAYPLTSCDSSTWLAMRRWGRGSEYCNNRKFSQFLTNMNYVLGQSELEDRNHEASDKVSAMQHHMLLRNWRNHLNNLQELGFDLCPPVEDEPE